jgi:hypothetical protein
MHSFIEESALNTTKKRTKASVSGFVSPFDASRHELAERLSVGLDFDDVIVSDWTIKV